MFGVVIASLIIKCFGMGNLVVDFTKEDLLASVLNIGAMCCSNWSLKFISFPLMALSKSSKLIPVMIIGSITGVFKLTWPKVIVSSGITIGLIMFSWEKFQGGFEGESIKGVFLLLVSLAFGGFTSIQVDKNRKTNKRAFAY